MDAIFGATEETAVSEDQQPTSPVEEENSAPDSEETLRNVPDSTDQEEGQEETQEQEKDAESSPGVSKRIDEMRRKLGDVERREERAWSEVDDLRSRIAQIEAVNKKEEVPKEQTIEYWQEVKRHPDYVDDQKVQDQCDVEIHRIVARQEIKVVSDASNQEAALVQQHRATYARMVVLHPESKDGTDEFNEAIKLFYESELYQAVPNGVELAINQHIAEKGAPTLQKAKTDQIETASKLKDEQQKGELGTSTRAGPRTRKTSKEKSAHDHFLKTNDAKPLLIERLKLNR